MPPQIKLLAEFLGLPLLMMTRKLFKGDFIFLAFGVISIIASIPCVPTVHGATTPSIPSRADFDWQKINPGAKLIWVKCYGSHECARLQVPLDYSNPTGDKAAVALLRVKAKVSPRSKNYRGPVLINPGGPGGSGVLEAFINGDRFQHVVGEEYDIVGFDPRGVGETTPIVSVFSDTAERSAWDGGTPPLLNSTEDALPSAFYRAELFSALVEQRSRTAAEHVSTAVVARDMLSIIKAHGRDRLQYWGVSYGSVLGATFAAMFPNNVERLVIDGVVDFDDYYSGGDTKSLLDTDKALQFLYDQCAKAGSACPLHASSGDLVRKRVDAIFASIKAKPMPVINGTDFGIIDFSVLKEGLFLTLYSPFAEFPPLAGALAALEGGNGLPFLTLWRSIDPWPRCDAPPKLGSSGREVQLAVVCGESERGNETIPGIFQHFEEQSKISIFADIWTDITRTSCVGWKVRAKEIFAGPFTVNTSFPLLIIGNTADPVTPLAGAQKAARDFSGSALLTINTPGHTSHAVTSKCTQKVIRDYFARGKLPKAGKVCEIEDVLFGTPVTSSGNSSAHGTTELVDVTRSLARRLYTPRRGSRFL